MSVQRTIGRLAELRQRLATVTRNLVSTSQHRTALLGRALHSVSPLATLDRGYSIVVDASTDKVLLHASDVSPGDDIRARLSRGALLATVRKVIENE